MEPVEINAGSYYLRQLRADELLDDRPALLEAFADDAHQRYVDLRIGTLAAAGDYVTQRAEEWAADRRCSWCVAEPTTGRMLGEVGLKKLNLPVGTAEAALWVHPDARGRGVAVAGLGAALRFGFGALGLHQVTYQHTESNAASAAVARRCGFRFARAENTRGGDREIFLTRGPEVEGA
ncbi:GNAT family N-acetyltransferase [Amycolatopsis cihanbeyliensis]|uniref:RimJ/RimL family protein N-acetyltransferase n=1 Tax=Amycolatopsis cihanbeyliensis TaxID=1128664 RepID=A0A542DNQ9_AMYCI|nr:GNAT family N-acetyltransferase [Amycolatopsis cihanbeyliensis]TQJ04731.1 RimJ/RimL family protein N-acetyltransferase [Amycolatopsis cihanbeyliensis]